MSKSKQRKKAREEKRKKNLEQKASLYGGMENYRSFGQESGNLNKSYQDSISKLYKKYGKKRSLRAGKKENLPAEMRAEMDKMRADFKTNRDQLEQRYRNPVKTKGPEQLERQRGQLDRISSDLAPQLRESGTPVPKPGPSIREMMQRRTQQEQAVREQLGDRYSDYERMRNDITGFGRVSDKRARTPEQMERERKERQKKLDALNTRFGITPPPAQNTTMPIGSGGPTPKPGAMIQTLGPESMGGLIGANPRPQSAAERMANSPRAEYGRRLLEKRYGLPVDIPILGKDLGGDPLARLNPMNPGETKEAYSSRLANLGNIVKQAQQQPAQQAAQQQPAQQAAQQQQAAQAQQQQAAQAQQQSTQAIQMGPQQQQAQMKAQMYQTEPAQQPEETEEEKKRKQAQIMGN